MENTHVCKCLILVYKALHNLAHFSFFSLLSYTRHITLFQPFWPSLFPPNHQACTSLRAFALATLWWKCHVQRFYLAGSCLTVRSQVTITFTARFSQPANQHRQPDIHYHIAYFYFLHCTYYYQMFLFPGYFFYLFIIRLSTVPHKKATYKFYENRHLSHSLLQPSVCIG